MIQDNDFNKFLGKQVFIVLKTKMLYNGIVKEVTDNFIFISDKFGKPVVINKSDVSSCEEK